MATLDCCNGTTEIPANTAGVDGILLESIPGLTLCCKPKSDYTDIFGETYEFLVRLGGGDVIGQIKIVARVGGITATNFDSTIFTIKNQEDICYSANLGELTGGEINFTSG